MKLVMYQYAERGYRLGAMAGEERIVDLNFADENLLAGKGNPRGAGEVPQPADLHAGRRRLHLRDRKLGRLSNPIVAEEVTSF